jgi:hypothetical protein
MGVVLDVVKIIVNKRGLKSVGVNEGGAEEDGKNGDEMKSFHIIRAVRSSGGRLVWIKIPSMDHIRSVMALKRRPRRIMLPGHRELDGHLTVAGLLGNLEVAATNARNRRKRF